MRHISLDCKPYIRCGPKVRQKIRSYALSRTPLAQDAVEIKAIAFRCADCMQQYVSDDFSSNVDVTRISCSNCYSDCVLVTRIEILIPSPKLLKKLEKAKASGASGCERGLQQ